MYTDTLIFNLDLFNLHSKQSRKYDKNIRITNNRCVPFLEILVKA